MSSKPYWIVDRELTEQHKREIVVARFATTREADRWLKERCEPGFGPPLNRYIVKNSTKSPR